MPHDVLYYTIAMREAGSCAREAVCMKQGGEQPPCPVLSCHQTEFVAKEMSSNTPEGGLVKMAMP